MRTKLSRGLNSSEVSLYLVNFSLRSVDDSNIKGIVCDRIVHR